MAASAGWVAAGVKASGSVLTTTTATLDASGPSSAHACDSSADSTGQTSSHLESKKVRTTTFPRSPSSDSGAPSWSTSENAGAGVAASRSRPMSAGRDAGNGGAAGVPAWLAPPVGALCSGGG